MKTSEMAGRLDARGPRFGFVCPPPHDPGWHRLADIDASVIGRWLDELPAAQAGMRNVAAAGTALKLANCVVRPLMAALHIERQFPDVTAADLYVERVNGGFGRLAVRAVPLLPAQPEVAAERLYGVFLPVLQAIRVDGKYGMRGLWGGLLDMIAAASLLVARTTGSPQPGVWATTERLLDAIAKRAHCKGRPLPFTVCYSGGEALFTVKSTCCLRYREHGLRAGEQSDNNDAYCHTCPFANDELRRRHYAEQMERR